MTDPTPSSVRSRPRPSFLPMSVGLILLACVAIELVLSAADFDWINVARLRAWAYEFGGFWPGLLRDWRPNYAGQPMLMFITYGFLHGGLVHLGVNMLTLVSLGRAVVDRVGQLRFVVLYTLAIWGGAAGYAALTTGLRPMVGASGALFGLAGALLAWDYVDRASLNEQLWPVVRMVGFLFLLNLVLWWAMDGQLAWETHLGGFLTGWIVALILDRQGTPRDQL